MHDSLDGSASPKRHSGGLFTTGSPALAWISAHGRTGSVSTTTSPASVPSASSPGGVNARAPAAAQVSRGSSKSRSHDQTIPETHHLISSIAPDANAHLSTTTAPTISSLGLGLYIPPEQAPTSASSRAGKDILSFDGIAHESGNDTAPSLDSLSGGGMDEPNVSAVLNDVMHWHVSPVPPPTSTSSSSISQSRHTLTQRPPAPSTVTSRVNVTTKPDTTSSSSQLLPSESQARVRIISSASQKAPRLVDPVPDDDDDAMPLPPMKAPPVITPAFTSLPTRRPPAPRRTEPLHLPLASKPTTHAAATADTPDVSAAAQTVNATPTAAAANTAPEKTDITDAAAVESTGAYTAPGLANTSGAPPASRFEVPTSNPMPHVAPSVRKSMEFESRRPPSRSNTPGSALGLYLDDEPALEQVSETEHEAEPDPPAKPVKELSGTQRAQLLDTTAPPDLMRHESDTENRDLFAINKRTEATFNRDPRPVSSGTGELSMYANARANGRGNKRASEGAASATGYTPPTAHDHEPVPMPNTRDSLEPSSMHKAVVQSVSTPRATLISDMARTPPQAERESYQPAGPHTHAPSHVQLQPSSQRAEQPTPRASAASPATEAHRTLYQDSAVHAPAAHEPARVSTHDRMRTLHRPDAVLYSSDVHHLQDTAEANATDGEQARDMTQSTEKAAAPALTTSPEGTAAAHSLRSVTAPAPPSKTQPHHDGGAIRDSTLLETRESSTQSMLQRTRTQRPATVYGYTGEAWDQLIDMEMATAYVIRIVERIRTFGVDMPLILSSMAMDLSAADTKRLIRTVIDTLRSPSTQADRAFHEELKFASVHSLVALLKWILARVGCVVAERTENQTLVLKQERGFVPWMTYTSWRAQESADGFSTLSYVVLARRLEKRVARLLDTVMDFLALVATHSAQNHMTPSKVGRHFGALVFGLPEDASFAETYGAYVRASNAAEHILLAFMRYHVSMAKASTYLPRRLLRLVDDYPRMLSPDLDASSSAVQTVPATYVARHVREYAHDLIDRASWPSELQGWDFAQETCKMLNVVPYRALRPRSSQYRHDSPTELADGYVSTLMQRWNEFSFEGFNDLDTSFLNFDLRESDRRQRMKRPESMQWYQFEERGFHQNADDNSRWDWVMRLDEPSEQMPVLVHEGVPRSESHVFQGEQVDFPYDTVPHTAETVMDELFPQVWADYLIGNGWSHRDERVHRDASFAVLQLQTDARPSSGRPADTAPSSPLSLSTKWYVLEEVVPAAYRDALDQLGRTRRHSMPMLRKLNQFRMVRAGLAPESTVSVVYRLGANGTAGVSAAPGIPAAFEANKSSVSHAPSGSTPTERPKDLSSTAARTSAPPPASSTPLTEPALSRTSAPPDPLPGQPGIPMDGQADMPPPAPPKPWRQEGAAAPTTDAHTVDHRAEQHQQHQHDKLQHGKDQHDKHQHDKRQHDKRQHDNLQRPPAKTSKSPEAATALGTTAATTQPSPVPDGEPARGKRSIRKILSSIGSPRRMHESPRMPWSPFARSPQLESSVQDHGPAVPMADAVTTTDGHGALGNAAHSSGKTSAGLLGNIRKRSSQWILKGKQSLLSVRAHPNQEDRAPVREHAGPAGAWQSDRIPSDGGAPTSDAPIHKDAYPAVDRTLPRAPEMDVQAAPYGQPDPQLVKHEDQEELRSGIATNQMHHLSPDTGASPTMQSPSSIVDWDKFSPLTGGASSRHSTPVVGANASPRADPQGMWRDTGAKPQGSPASRPVSMMIPRKQTPILSPEQVAAISGTSLAGETPPMFPRRDSASPIMPQPTAQESRPTPSSPLVPHADQDRPIHSTSSRIASGEHAPPQPDLLHDLSAEKNAARAAASSKLTMPSPRQQPDGIVPVVIDRHTLQSGIGNAAATADASQPITRSDEEPRHGHSPYMQPAETTASTMTVPPHDPAIPTDIETTSTPRPAPPPLSSYSANEETRAMHESSKLSPPIAGAMSSPRAYDTQQLVTVSHITPVAHEPPSRASATTAPSAWPPMTSTASTLPATISSSVESHTDAVGQEIQSPASQDAPSATPLAVPALLQTSPPSTSPPVNHSPVAPPMSWTTLPPYVFNSSAAAYLSPPTPESPDAFADASSEFAAPSTQSPHMSGPTLPGVAPALPQAMPPAAKPHDYRLSCITEVSEDDATRSSHRFSATSQPMETALRDASVQTLVESDGPRTRAPVEEVTEEHHGHPYQAYTYGTLHHGPTRPAHQVDGADELAHHEHPNVHQDRRVHESPDVQEGRHMYASRDMHGVDEHENADMDRIREARHINDVHTHELQNHTSDAETPARMPDASPTVPTDALSTEHGSSVSSALGQTYSATSSVTDSEQEHDAKRRARWSGLYMDALDVLDAPDENAFVHAPTEPRHTLDRKTDLPSSVPYAMLPDTDAEEMVGSDPELQRTTDGNTTLHAQQPDSTAVERADTFAGEPAGPTRNPFLLPQDTEARSESFAPWLKPERTNKNTQPPTNPAELAGAYVPFLRDSLEATDPPVNGQKDTGLPLPTREASPHAVAESSSTTMPPKSSFGRVPQPTTLESVPDAEAPADNSMTSVAVARVNDYDTRDTHAPIDASMTSRAFTSRDIAPADSQLPSVWTKKTSQDNDRDLLKTSHAQIDDVPSLGIPSPTSMHLSTEEPSETPVDSTMPPHTEPASTPTASSAPAIASKVRVLSTSKLPAAAAEAAPEGSASPVQTQAQAQSQAQVPATLMRDMDMAASITNTNHFAISEFNASTTESLANDNTDATSLVRPNFTQGAGASQASSTADSAPAMTPTAPADTRQDQQLVENSLPRSGSSMTKLAGFTRPSFSIDNLMQKSHSRQSHQSSASSLKPDDVSTSKNALPTSPTPTTDASTSIAWPQAAQADTSSDSDWASSQHARQPTVVSTSTIRRVDPPVEPPRLDWHTFSDETHEADTSIPGEFPVS